METVSVEVGEIGTGIHSLPLDGLDSRLRGNDGSTAVFALLYLPCNGYQAGSKPASAKVDMGRGEGHSPSASFFSYPQEWGIKGG